MPTLTVFLLQSSPADQRAERERSRRQVGCATARAVRPLASTATRPLPSLRTSSIGTPRPPHHDASTACASAPFSSTDISSWIENSPSRCTIGWLASVIPTL